MKRQSNGYLLTLTLTLTLTLLLSPLLLRAAEIGVTVVDSAGSMVSNAVVGLFPSGDAAGETVMLRNRAGRPVLLDQVNKQFVPHVLAIQAGTAINFPNSDNIRHQVYSFSEAKRFELKLYSGRAAPPVVFDVPGVVVLGCNIHDWMSAYLYVLDTPYFAQTDATGFAAIDVPPGLYMMKIWHPRHERGREAITTAVRADLDRMSVRQSIPLAPIDDSSGLPPS